MSLMYGFSIARQNLLQKIKYALLQLIYDRVVVMVFVFFIALELILLGFIQFCASESWAMSRGIITVFRLNTWMCLFLLFLCFIQAAVDQSLLHTAQGLYQCFKGSSVRFKSHFFTALTVLIAAIYLSTGTLSPYANTINAPPDYPLVEPECHYLLNGDYEYFVALFFLLDGKPKHTWESSIVLRRILYNIIAYPVMKLFEHDLGGIIANLLLTVLAFFSFALFSLRTSGEAGTIAGLWLLAVFPGITYYSGQPFLYALIVPGCLWLYMLLWKLDKDMSTRCVWIVSMGMGLLFTGYDFMAFFGFAALMMLVVRKKYHQIPAALFGMLFFSALWLVVLRYCLGSLLSNNNSDIYGNILRSYFQPASFDLWVGLIKKLPASFVANFFYSCFIFLPMLFIISACVYKRRLILPETCVLFSIGLVFLFINCSPPRRPEWMSGTWIARLYSPMFVVLLFYLTRVFQDVSNPQQGQHRKWFLNGLLVVTVLANAAVAFGPALNDPAGFSSMVYHEFYTHGSPKAMKYNLSTYGRRPWGFCR
jgi:hypothetical protein